MKLLHRVEEVCRVRRYSPRTAQAYTHWIGRYLKAVRARDGRWRVPDELGAADVQWYLTGLATKRKVSASSLPLGRDTKNVGDRWSMVMWWSGVVRQGSGIMVCLRSSRWSIR